MRSLLLTFSFIFSFLHAISIEEMVGEMLIVHFHGTEANQESAKLLNEAYVGGFIFYNWANKLTSPAQVLKLTSSLKQQAGKPLFFAVDQEGGRVVRLKEGFTAPPYAGEIQSSYEAYCWAKKIGKELNAVGINMNLAPVVDVNSNPANPVIGLRSYSNDPEVVVERALCALMGYHRTGIIAVLKHFPGHGDTNADSHYNLPVIKKNLAELEQTELFPFKELCQGAPAIMTAHLFLPELDPVHPVTVSPTIIKDILIKDMGFKGLIMTDSLAMQAILDYSESVEEIAIQAIEAGHDILLLGGKQLLKSNNGFEFSPEDIVSIHGTICKAVKEGRLPEERIERSYQKILQLKNKI